MWIAFTGKPSRVPVDGISLNKAIDYLEKAVKIVPHPLNPELPVFSHEEAKTLRDTRKMDKYPGAGSSWNVVASEDPEADLQARWTDAKGRTQYGYHPRFRAKQSASKFANVHYFSSQLPNIRERISKDFNLPDGHREKVTAAIVRLIDKTAMRVGGAKHADKNGTYGASSLLKEHVSFGRGGIIRFTFKGKAGKDHSIEVNDPQLSRVIRGLVNTGEHDKVFMYRRKNGQFAHVGEAGVVRYLRPFRVHPHQFRHYHATRIATDHLMSHPDPSPKVREGHIKDAIAAAAKHLGNSPSEARDSYIVPDVLQHYREGRV